MSDPARETRLLDVLGRLVRELSRISGTADDGPAITTTQRLCLIETLEHEPIRLNDLADRLGVSPPTASRAVDALVDLEMLERMPDPGDRRAVRITLTDSGRATIEARKARVLQAFLPAAATMQAEDQERLVELLSALADALTAERVRPGRTTRAS